MKITKGCLVKRKKGTCYKGMGPGDTDIVLDISDDKKSLILKRYGYGHSPSSLEIITTTLKDMLEELQ